MKAIVLFFGLAGALASGMAHARAAAETNKLSFCCRPDNDLFKAAMASGLQCSRYETAAGAVEHAPASGGVLVLADGYPETRTEIPPDVYAAAARKSLRLYVEFPVAVPGIEIGEVRKTEWERVVVASDRFGPALPRLRILMVHGCHFTPIKAHDPLLVVGRVAGFDDAVFGLPKESFPILFEVPERSLVVATTKLSGFATGRYAPVHEWAEFWRHMLGRMAGKSLASLRCEPLVRPKYGPEEPLPADAERKSLAAMTQWIRDSGLLLGASRVEAAHKVLASGAAWGAVPQPGAISGDGRLGMLEGFGSQVDPDGQQKYCTALRMDCHAEIALCMALDFKVTGNEQSRKIAENLLDHVFFTSDAQRGPRGNPAHPAFGHVAWGIGAPAWFIGNYGDDNARVIEAATGAAACLNSDRWNEPILRALLANLRTTGTLGFRGDRVDIGPLEQLGWKHFHDAQTVSMRPFFEAGIWACYLWAYRHTQHAPFLEKPRTAIRKTMEAYPDGWLWRNNLERVRMIHALAWLIRVEDKPEYRAWLRRLCDDLLACQDETGAIREVIGTKGQGHYQAPTSNEEYGTREMPIIQDNGDSASDQLYVTGFALLVLHEASPILKDPRLAAAEDKLAAYLCRIQVRSERLPYLNGGWFRAFDFKRWEYWASSGDAGWGAWSMEAGWGQAWTAATMGLRAMKTNLWDLTAASNIGLHLRPVQELMDVNDGGPWKPTTQPGR